MFGINAEAWLADHDRTHRDLVEAAAALRGGSAVAIQPSPAPAATSELACC